MSTADRGIAPSPASDGEAYRDRKDIENPSGGKTVVAERGATWEHNVNLQEAAQLRPTKLRGKSLNALVSFVCGTGFILFGYDVGVLGGLLTLPAFKATFPETADGFKYSNSATLQSLMVAIYELGCMAGALSNLYIGDRIGRRRTISLGGIVVIIGAAIQAGSINYAMMLVARIINGFGNGLLTSTVPAYQSECAKPHQRGKLVLLQGAFIALGIFMSYWIDLGFYYTSGGVSWRVPIGLQIIFPVLMIALMHTAGLPESPRWLCQKGRNTEALAVLAALDNKPVDDAELVRTLNGIMDAVAVESAEDVSYAELLEGGRTQNFRRVTLGVLAQCFQQISGVNMIQYYLTPVLVAMGLSEELARIIGGVQGTCYLITDTSAMFLVDRFGRRPLMLTMAVAQGVTLVIMAGVYNLNNQGNKGAQAISVLCIFLFNTWFSWGWAGMTWLYPAEIAPLRIRAKANALSTASNWLFNFLVVMVTGPMFATIGWGTYAFWGLCNLLIIFPTVFFFFPETKNYSLEDLDIIFAHAYNEGVSPVGVSKAREIPKAGTREAEIILGQASR